ncbi:gibberellin 2-beta-dioxygenase 8 [Coffea eugenioides]|uniref:gibberellin 2-beta-dioxygenase 8 n=1 Tax=Coffea eugenioides TaxID=49369 RepID=UPI000F6047FF|nr:gibberellin 2-beta-dioxygenase 8 [Coffea eugenioides]
MSQTEYDSYPPLFRPRRSPTLPSPDSDDFFNQQVPDFDPVPVIDSECINQKKLDEACREWGMFRLINHGIPLTLLNKLHDHAKKLFSLAYESKQASFTPPISYFWGTPGLTPSGVVIQRDVRAQNFNWLEGFHVLLTPLSQLQYEDPMLDSFRCLLEEYGRQQTRLATTIFEALAKNLQLDSERTRAYLSTATGHLRVHRYPCCFEAEQLRAWGIDVHTDSSVLSILHEDEIGGLQVCSNNQWFDVKPQFDSLIVNLGDMMQAMSDDNYIGAKHRVKVNKHKERISVGYFVLPYEDTVIESSKYKPFTYADFRAEVQRDLKTVGYKIGLQKFKLSETF